MLLFLLLLQANPTPPAWYRDPVMVMTIATIVIAVATVVYVVATILLWKETRDSVNITRETFEHSIKPIVAVPDISPTNKTDVGELTFTVTVENFGSVPAVEVKTSAEVSADGRPLNVTKHETGLLLIVPHSRIVTTFVLDGENYRRAIGSAVLNFRFSTQYEGVAQKKYQYDFEGVYYPNKNEFQPTNAKATDLGKQK
jgi:archaellum component FlaG (FlaF/FlaG flagellin family)